MDDYLYTAAMEVVTERVNYHGANEPKGLQDALNTFKSAVNRLQETLTTERAIFFMDCETYYSGLDGEQMRFYYEAGFADAVGFLLGWKEGWSK